MRSWAVPFLFLILTGCASNAPQPREATAATSTPAAMDPLVVWGNVSIAAGAIVPCADAPDGPPRCTAGVLVDREGWNAPNASWQHATLNASWTGASLPRLRVVVMSKSLDPIAETECGAGRVSTDLPPARVVGERAVGVTACDGPGESPLVAFRVTYALTLR